MKIFSDLLKGACDIHVHNGPSLVPRSLDDVEAVQHGIEAGMAAIVLKDQYFVTTHQAELINKYIFKDAITKAYGAIVLNNHVGGLSPHTVDAAIKSGAKIVWMPTVCAGSHLKRREEMFKQGLPHKGAPLPAGSFYSIAPLRVIDDDGKILNDVSEICKLIAQADIVLGTGHISIEETRALIDEAKKQRVKKIILDHPNILEYTDKDIIEMVEKGVMVELVAAPALGEDGGIDEMVKLIKLITPENIAICSDLGLPRARYPVDGLNELIIRLLDSGIKEEAIDTMLCKNPSKLLDLDSN